MCICCSFALLCSAFRDNQRKLTSRALASALKIFLPLKGRVTFVSAIMSTAQPKQPPPKRATALQVLESKDLAGKSYLVTGANSGIGFETGRALALHGARVLLACRNMKAAEACKEKITTEKPSALVEIVQLDLGDFNSVEKCAKTLCDDARPLHCLILNAGVYNPNPRVSEAGLEATFQVNHLAHFYFAKLLEEKMVQSAPSRIVVVATVGHKGWRIGTTPLSDITRENFSPTSPPNQPLRAYALSKLANVMHAKGLQKRLGPKGVTACSLHPGVIKTNIDRNSGLWKFLFATLAQPWRINEEQGAATSVYCATVDDLADFGAGQYFADCRIDACAEAAQDPERVEAMWQLSEQLIDEWKNKK